MRMAVAATTRKAKVGVLVLRLAEGTYDWAFRSTPDDLIEDQGMGVCS